jgi:hypothetical protein
MPKSTKIVRSISSGAKRHGYGETNSTVHVIINGKVCPCWANYFRHSRQSLRVRQVRIKIEHSKQARSSPIALKGAQTPSASSAQPKYPDARISRERLLRPKRKAGRLLNAGIQNFIFAPPVWDRDCDENSNRGSFQNLTFSRACPKEHGHYARS